MNEYSAAINDLQRRRKLAQEMDRQSPAKGMSLDQLLNLELYNSPGQVPTSPIGWMANMMQGRNPLALRGGGPVRLRDPLELLPGSGELIDAHDARMAYNKGDYPGMALPLTALAVPGALGAVHKVFSKLNMGTELSPLARVAERQQGVMAPAPREDAMLSASLHYPAAKQDILSDKVSKDLTDFGTMPSGVAPGETHVVRHYSTQQDPDVLRGGAYGTNWPGGEKSYLATPAGESTRGRVMFYLGDTPRETGVGAYEHEMALSGLYDREADPEGIVQKVYDTFSKEPRMRNVRAAEIDRAIKEAGYRGAFVRSSGRGYVFEDIDLRPEAVDTLQARRELHERMGIGDKTQVPGGEQFGQNADVGSGIGTPFRREASTGRYVGMPPGTNTPQKLSSITREGVKDAMTGMGARDWYPESGMAVNQLTGGNQKQTVDLSSAIAITSPEQRVDPNMRHGANMMYKHALDMFPAGGKYPNDMGNRLLNTMADPSTVDGRKVSTFRNNLLRSIMPEVPQGATIDRWMMRLFDMPTDKSPTNPQYTALERTIGRITDRLNKDVPKLERPYTPDEVQAALWTVFKGGTEGKPLDISGESYLHAARRYRGQIPWESRPGGSFAGENPVLGSEFSAVQNQFHTDVHRLLTDDYGRNIIDANLGLYNMPGYRGQGVWMDEYNPNTIDQPFVPVFYDRVTPAAKELLDASAITRAMVLDQDGASWFGPMLEVKTKKQHNARELMFSAPSREYIRVISNKIDELRWDIPGLDFPDDAVVPVPTRDGVRLVGPPGQGKAMDTLMEQLEPMLEKQSKLYGYGYGGYRRGKVESNYIPRGEYEERISQLSPKLQDKIRETISTTRPYIENLQNHYNRADPDLLQKAQETIVPPVAGVDVRLR